jgi:hypothetical protein
MNLLTTTTTKSLSQACCGGLKMKPHELELNILASEILSSSHIFSANNSSFILVA